MRTVADLWNPNESASGVGLLEQGVDEARTGLHAAWKRSLEGVPQDWRERIPMLFPHYVRAPFAPHHEELWEWEQAIEIESTPLPFVLILARGGGKSTSAELVAVDLGLSGRRNYVLYVRRTQEKADDSVSNIGGLLERDTVSYHYPAHASKMVGKYGDSRGWRRNRLTTAGGFVVDALGLDVASRGTKFDEQRPDLIILDDIDDEHDKPETTAKKIRTITRSILPAGASNVAVLAIQNMVIPDGFFARMAKGTADYLARRIVSGPHPAVRDLEYERVEQGPDKPQRAVVTGGTPTWEGQNLSVVQHQIDNWGLDAFLKEAQHEVDTPSEEIIFGDKWFSQEFEPQPHWDGPYQGLDFGFGVDPLVLVRCWIHANVLYVSHEAYAVGKDIHKYTSFFGEHVENYDGYTTQADSARPESVSYLRQHGMPKTVGVAKWPGSVKDGITYLRSFDRIVIHPRCTGTIAEIKAYRYKVGPGGVVTSEPEDANNNAPDAIRYALVKHIQVRRKRGWGAIPSTRYGT